MNRRDSRATISWEKGQQLKDLPWSYVRAVPLFIPTLSTLYIWDEVGSGLKTPFAPSCPDTWQMHNMHILYSYWPRSMPVSVLTSNLYFEALTIFSLSQTLAFPLSVSPGWRSLLGSYRAHFLSSEGRKRVSLLLSSGMTDLVRLLLLIILSIFIMQGEVQSTYLVFGLPSQIAGIPFGASDK